MPFSIGNYVSKNLSTPSGFLRAAALMTVTAAVAGGVIFKFGVTRSNPATLAQTTDRYIAANFVAKELVQGCVGSGTSTATGCVQVIAGVTNQAFIFTKSGGYIVGSFASPTAVISGALMRIGGGYPAAGVELSVVGDMSGSTLRIDSLGGKKNRILCVITGALVGYCSTNAAANCGCKAFNE